MNSHHTASNKLNCLNYFRNNKINTVFDSLNLFRFFYSSFIQFRLTVEVADFNFGETSSIDLEYKSFVRRLIDSVRDALPSHHRLVNEVDESDDPSLRYRSMT